MDICVIIPCFLAILFYNTFTKWDRWVYYPEYTYDVNITFWMAPENDQMSTYATNTTLELKCRDTYHNSLVCSLERQRMSIRSATMTDNDRLHLTVNAKQLFEAKFDERGIESLVVQLPGITDAKLNTIRLIANQLSIGIGLPEQTGKLFLAKEKSIHGECDTLFKVEGAKSVDNIDKLPNETMVLWFLSQGMRAEEQGIIVEKTRNTRKCDRSNRYVINENGYTANLNITSSFQRIKIADPQIFESYTVAKGKLLVLHNMQYFSVSETTSMRLRNISFVQGLPIWFPDGGKTSIFYNERIENNFVD